MNLMFWSQSMGVVILGAVGTVLFKVGVNQYPEINLTDPLSILKFILSPYIFLSLAILLLGRVLTSLPLQSVDVGKYMLILTPLTLIATLALSNLVLGESVNAKQMVGIVISLIGVYLLGF